MQAFLRKLPEQEHARVIRRHQVGKIEYGWPPRLAAGRLELGQNRSGHASVNSDHGQICGLRHGHTQRHGARWRGKIDA
jgi:hypothetical protein